MSRDHLFWDHNSTLRIDAMNDIPPPRELLACAEIEQVLSVLSEKVFRKSWDFPQTIKKLVESNLKISKEPKLSRALSNS